MIARFRTLLRERLARRSLTAAVRTETDRDAAGLPPDDVGSDVVESAAVRWFFDAQDHSKSADGGFARHYSLVTGWSKSYAETTGYLIPTLLRIADRRQMPEARERARRALDWLVRIQLRDGSFYGGIVDARPQVPVSFNTGQILFGLVAGYRTFGNGYEEPMHRAARWLVDTIDRDGCWRRNPTPFAIGGDKAYDTHIAWALVEAAKATGVQAYADTALRNARWAVTQQTSRGWFDKCCLTDPTAPLTHTLGYAIRGIVEVHRHTHDAKLGASAITSADAVSQSVGPDGFLAGRLRSDWSPGASWCCLTGSAQIAHSLLLLSAEEPDHGYQQAASSMLRYVRRTIQPDGPVGVRGGVKGSFPTGGDYGRFEFLAWAAKFLLDANAAEQRIVHRSRVKQEATSR